MTDKKIAWVYGDPDSADITFDERYVVIAGCGITIYDIESEETTNLFSEPDLIEWTQGIYIGEDDDEAYVRYNALTDTDKLVIMRLNLISKEVEILS
jgi:hypothetical protein